MRYLTAEEVLALHDLIIEMSGGADGIRDINLLQSAVIRPQTHVGGKDAFATIFEKAATYLDSLAHHHVFIDGNKRTAFAAAAAFLYLNGYTFTASDKEVVQYILHVATKKPTIIDIAKWLEKNTKNE